MLSTTDVSGEAQMSLKLMGSEYFLRAYAHGN